VDSKVLLSRVASLAPAIDPDGGDFPSGWEDVFGGTLHPPAVLMVDPVELNRRLLRATFKTAPYRFLEASRPSEALAVLEREKIDLVVLELMLPEMSGLELCRRLKSDRHTQLIPILILTSAHGSDNEVAGMSSGADDVLIKPFHPAVLRAHVRAMLRNKAAIDSLEEAEAILFALAQTVEQRDPYTGGHCQRLATYGLTMGLALGLSRPELLALHRGAYLHDIGKISIPERILLKDGKLTDEEWAIKKMHTVKGEEICRSMKSLAAVLPIIRSHHERWDGSGYPDGLIGEQIPLLARILQVVDIYDALNTARPYKLAKTHQESIEVLQAEADRGWRDPELVSLFRELSSTIQVFTEAIYKPRSHHESYDLSVAETRLGVSATSDVSPLALASRYHALIDKQIAGGLLPDEVVELEALSKELAKPHEATLRSQNRLLKKYREEFETLKASLDSKIEVALRDRL
jgi:putative two-component system response regulator